MAGKFKTNDRQQFQPSSLSYSPEESALMQIRVMRKMLDGLEGRVKDGLPRWVSSRLSTASQEMTLVGSYLQAMEERESSTRTKS
jgi:hypothetical protein